MRSVVLLRSANLGPRNKVAMADLRRLLEGLGLADVVTHLSSGNAVGTGDVTAEQVRDALRRELGLDLGVVVLTGQQLAAALERHPFDTDEGVAVAFADGPVEQLPPLDVAPDEAVPGDRVVYLRYAAGQQRSRLGAPLLEKALPGRVLTVRTWTSAQGLLRKV